jgi:hypothetical protein
MDDLRTDFGLGIPRPALFAAAVLADGFMIRTSFRCSGAAWRRHRHKPRRHYRLGLWDPRFRPAAGDQRHARSVGRGSPVDLSRRENEIYRLNSVRVLAVLCLKLARVRSASGAVRNSILPYFYRPDHRAGVELVRNRRASCS